MIKFKATNIVLNPEQHKYIDTLREKYPAIPEQTLRATLTQAGWTPEVIDDAVLKYNGATVTAPATPASTLAPAPVPPRAVLSGAEQSIVKPTPSTVSEPVNRPSQSPVSSPMQSFGKPSLPIVQIGAGVGAVIVVLVLLFFLFSGKSSKPDGKAPVASVQGGAQAATTPTPASGAIAPPKGGAQPVSNDLVAATYKDSILRSLDGGETFETYFTIATTSKLGVADVLSISFHPLVKDKVVVTTYQDGLFFNQGRENKWDPVAFPPKRIYSFILDKKRPDNRIFASGVVDNNGRIFRTSDAGALWRAVYAEPGANTYVSSIAQDPKVADTIIAGTSGGTVVKSLDGGDTWQNVGQKINGNISTLGYDAVKKGFVYLLSYQSNVYYSPNGGQLWYNWEEEKQKEVDSLRKRAAESSTHGDPKGAQALNDQAQALATRNQENRQPNGILLIVPDPSVSGVIYAGTSAGLYRSPDYGKYWYKINIIESAEGYPIRSIAINPKNSNELSFVSGKSFYKSKNKGDTWATVPLDNSRNASFVAYDPFDTKVVFIGMSAI